MKQWNALMLASALILGMVAGSLAQTMTERTDYGMPPPNLSAILDHVVASYPDHLTDHTDSELIFKDGTRMVVSDGRTDKDFQTLLNEPDFDDMFAFFYNSGTPQIDRAMFDPGRIRYEPFFRKIYGDCRKARLDLVKVKWTYGGRLKASKINEIDQRLTRVAKALEALPKTMRTFVSPTSGGYNCRTIAGTERLSVHAFGAAFDGHAKKAAYWRWMTLDGETPFNPNSYMPDEVVDEFEREGFIWGGRWHHFDTMHFEYRPEMIPPIE